MNVAANQQFIEDKWDHSIVPALIEYVRIPNKSPLFDADWQKNGFMQQAVTLMTDWCQQQAVPGMILEVVQLENRTPLIYLEIPGASADTILLYGHLDKQPEMTGWDADLGPWQPVIKDDKLYGRGAADDGYAIFASLTAIMSLQAQGIPHARCVILIEACEESGSYDLPFYIDELQDRIGNPKLVICLDSGCGNYEQLWMTTSLRGLVGGVLEIEVLKQGIHSGLGSGIVPSCFMVLRELLARVEEKTTGKILLSELQVEIPSERVEQASRAGKILGATLQSAYPFVKGVTPVNNDNTDLILNRTWRSALSITGAEGLPALANAGNVTLPKLSLKLSMRIPPTCDNDIAGEALKKTLETNPPFNARVKFNLEDTAAGWNAPIESPWLHAAAIKASQTYFGKEALYMGEGGSIPFMGMLGKKFPQAQFLITGVLGPASNAHGPNEFLHIPTGKKLTCCVAEIIAEQYIRSQATCFGNVD
jgi:acetylornithine deacetylase/succinyl-diaminopimelate desuccinylase-like protein